MTFKLSVMKWRKREKSAENGHNKEEFSMGECYLHPEKCEAERRANKKIIMVMGLVIVIFGGIMAFESITGNPLLAVSPGQPIPGTPGYGTGAVSCPGSIGQMPGIALSSPNFNVVVYPYSNPNGGPAAGVTSASGTFTVNLNPGVYYFLYYPSTATTSWNPAVAVILIPALSTGGAAASTYQLPMLIAVQKPSSVLFTAVVGSNVFTTTMSGVPDAGVTTTTTASSGLAAGTVYTVTLSVQVNTAFSQLGPGSFVAPYLGPGDTPSLPGVYGPQGLQQGFISPLYPAYQLGAFLQVIINNTAQNIIYQNYPAGSVWGTINATANCLWIPVPTIYAGAVAVSWSTSFQFSVPVTSGNAYLEVFYGYNSTISTISQQHGISAPPSTAFTWLGSATKVLSLELLKTKLGI